MQFHTTEKTKIQIAHDIALSMAYASYRNGDQIGGASYTEHIEKYIPTSKKKLNLYTLHTLITSSEIFRSNLANAFSTLINYKLKNHLIIIISDDFLETQHTELIKLAQQNEILYINIFDPFEMNLSIHENIESSEKTIPHIRISENNKLQEIALDNTTKKHYIKKFKEKQKYTERTIRSLGGDYLIITTDEDPIKKLMELFYKRSMRK